MQPNEDLAAAEARAEELSEAGDVLDAFNLLLTGRDLAREESEPGGFARWQAAVEAFARRHGIRLG